jgi:hypothetical protein
LCLSATPKPGRFVIRSSNRQICRIFWPSRAAEATFWQKQCVDIALEVETDQHVGGLEMLRGGFPGDASHDFGFKLTDQEKGECLAQMRHDAEPVTISAEP